MLFWENEHPDYGQVHHLMVLCYYLQHPSLYAPAGLAFAQSLLVDFVVRGISPAESLQRSRGQVDSGRRNWKIKATPNEKGSYEQPVHWRMTAVDVVAAGVEQYIQQVRKWAETTYADLVESGSLPGT